MLIDINSVAHELNTHDSDVENNFMKSDFFILSANVSYLIIQMQMTNEGHERSLVDLLVLIVILLSELFVH